MKKYFYLFCNALLVMLAVFSGGAVAMAMAVGTIGSDTDPNAGNPLATATKDDPGKGIDAQSKGTTGSAMRDAGLVLDEINDYVTRFRAYQFPMHTDFLTRAKQIKVDTKEPSNYEIGEAILDCVTETAYTALDT